MTLSATVGYIMLIRS